MKIMTINCGSSSIKADIRDHFTGEYVAQMLVERVGDETPILHINEHQEALDAPDAGPQALLELAIPRLLASTPADIDISGVGHRVVHGGNTFTHPVRITDEVEATIESLFPLAPLHNPANLAGIRAARHILPDVHHVAIFDTAFHSTLPRRAQAYALPYEYLEDKGIRRFGFHGISHGFVAQKAADFLDADLRDLRLITCHLGNGASLCAVEYGRSIETSMGMTPLEGLVMGTRSGDIDPGVMLHLMREYGFDIDGLDNLLNRKSGLSGISGVGKDMRDIQNRAADGDDRCRLAIQVFAHRVRKYIGAYAAVMGGVDAIVFTGGIGEHSAMIRHRIAQRLEFLGALLDEDANRAARVSPEDRVARISSSHSRCHLLVIETDESRAIAEKTAQIILEADRLNPERTIPVAVSARHIHLQPSTIEKLFGPGYKLTPRNDLSQPGQFACEETVKVIGPRNEFSSVRILGPARSLDQLEISRTDEFHLGVDAPVRASGDIKNSPGILLEGPHGQVELKQGVICAARHIHMTPEDALHFGVNDRDIVEVAITGGERDLIFGDVLIRVSPKFRLEMHIDTDEGNAAHLGKGAQGMLVSTEGMAQLRRRKTSFDPIPDAAE